MARPLLKFGCWEFQCPSSKQAPLARSKERGCTVDNRIANDELSERRQS